MSNIAEGFERGSTTEFVQFLYIAKGSCGEVRAQLMIAADQEYIQQGEYERQGDSAESGFPLVGVLRAVEDGEDDHSCRLNLVDDRVRKPADQGSAETVEDGWVHEGILLNK